MMSLLSLHLRSPTIGSTPACELVTLPVRCNFGSSTISSTGFGTNGDVFCVAFDHARFEEVAAYVRKIIRVNSAVHR